MQKQIPVFFLFFFRSQVILLYDGHGDWGAHGMCGGCSVTFWRTRLVRVYCIKLRRKNGVSFLYIMIIKPNEAISRLSSLWVKCLSSSTQKGRGKKITQSGGINVPCRFLCKGLVSRPRDENASDSLVCRNYFKLGNALYFAIPYASPNAT